MNFPSSISHTLAEQCVGFRSRPWGGEKQTKKNYGFKRDIDHVV